VPSDTFSHTTSVAADAATIYRALQEPETWKGIGPIDDVWDATHDDDQLTAFRWSARAAGRSWEGTAERVTGDSPPSMALGLDSPEVSGRITVVVTPNGDSSEMTVTMVARSKGLLAGMFWGVIADALSSGLPTQVDAFRSRF
jgi:hypothetical protein